ncbi:MAG: metallophosphoesterase [Saccharospirillum sp.]|nr:metallophosphoesterase [Saccharospirillum sp.]
MYDIIGDIHGHAAQLKQLLHSMGYSDRDGVWRHPERKVVFLGDFVDRGPEQVETVHIAKRMVEADLAYAVMGNHEFNAVAWATKHPKNSGSYLRDHSAKNREQHQAFLDQVSEGSDTHKELLKWFKTLPLFLELDGIRVVHACWHPEHLKSLEAFLDQQNCIRAGAWLDLALENGAGYDSLEVVLKGLEIDLPEGYSFRDKSNHPRTAIRTAWWNLDATTYHDVAMVPGDEIRKIPKLPIEDGSMPGYDGKKPVFIGHYWLQGSPAPLHPSIACLDYSVASDKGGKLCAYRWQGERTLTPENYCWVERTV